MAAVRLMVPTLEREPWPTLGPEVCDWIETFCVHGPGDVLGEPVVLSDEERFVLYRAYEVFPKGHPREGRRRFKRVVVSRRKGWAKTELAAFIALGEMDPRGPVRCDGFRKEGGAWVPVGRSVRDPYIPMVAYTEEQTEDLAYSAVFEIITRGELVDDYDVGLERILHTRAAGKLQALASSPSARDGARTTFQHFDETHRFILLRLKRAHATMLRNVPKRKDADAWSLETTTMYAPGEESVAEESHAYAKAVEAGEVSDADLYFDHLEASELHDLSKPSELKRAIKEASGDAVAYADIDAIAATYRDPTGDKNEFRRYWLNQPRGSAKKAFSLELVDALAEEGASRIVAPDEPIVLSFDGSYARDATALVAATVEERPHVFVVAVWERPLGQNRNWRVPVLEVKQAVEDTMDAYEVVEFAPDPPGWRSEIEEWEQAYGEEVVVRFETNQPTRMGPACDEFTQALGESGMTLDADSRFRRHLGNCVEKQRGSHVVVTKEHKDSPNKIDIAVGAIVAFHRARWHWLHAEEPVTPFAFFA